MMLESDINYASFLEQLPEPVIAINSRGVITSCNAAVKTKFDYSVEDLKGKNVSVLVPEPDRDQHDGYIERYLRTGEKRIIDFGRKVTVRCKSGKVVPAFLTVCEQKTPEGSCFIGLLRDLSELDLTNARLNAILNLTPSDIVYIDLEFRVRYANHGLRALFPLGIVGNSVIELMSEDERQAFRGQFEACLRAQESRSFTLTFQSAQGERPFAANMSPIREGGTVTGAVLVMTDISEKLELEKSQRKLLIQKELLLKEVYHRVKNNFQVIQSLLAINEIEEPNEQAREVLRDTRNRIFAMASIHDQILEQNERARLDLMAYLSLIDANFRMANHTEYSGGISPNLQVTVSPPAAPVLVSPELATACGVIFTELLTNSVKYARSQSNLVHIFYGLQAVRDRVLFRYADSGPLYSEGQVVRDSRADKLVAPVSSGMGRKIINSFAETSDGEIQYVPFADWLTLEKFAEFAPQAVCPKTCFLFQFRRALV